jgi:glycosyltransferase involved in cell wall biosynthesis
MGKMKRKVLIMAGYYIPSVKGGGPIRSIKNLVDELSNKIDFYIVADDRDLGDDKPFHNIKTNEWMQIDKEKVYYINKKLLTWKKIKALINSIDYDILYLNSFFAYNYSIIPILLNKVRKIPRKQIVVAPRGQFYKGALAFKKQKKKLFINLAKSLGLFNDVVWHATNYIERKEILKIFGENSRIIIANNLTTNYENFRFTKKIKKNKGELKIVFISRIHPNKNLKMAIELLKQIKGKIEFNIYGPLEDISYWSECMKLINTIPSNLNIEYKGVIEHEKIIDVFKNHHVFFLPTLGENFGHIISEALIGGCPVIISDQTPWRNLEKKHAGWDIDLNDKNRFIHVLQYCVNMTQEQYNVLSRAAFWYAKKLSNKEEGNRYLYELFSDI